eukprot:scaffold284928_cov18-Tisochrysis_lutea.AAC.3
MDNPCVAQPSRELLTFQKLLLCFRNLAPGKLQFLHKFLLIVLPIKLDRYTEPKIDASGGTLENCAHKQHACALLRCAGLK